METKIDFKLAVGIWNASEDKEQIQINAYKTNGLDIPMADIEMILNNEGNEAGRKIIASTHDTYIMGDKMNLHPFWVQILGRDRIALTNKETGSFREYIRA